LKSVPQNPKKKQILAELEKMLKDQGLDDRIKEMAGESLSITNL